MAKTENNVIDVLEGNTITKGDIKMAKTENNVIDVLEGNTITKNVNTLSSIKKPATDVELQKEEFKKASSIAKGPRKKFKASTAYAGLYPDGLTTTFQGITINVIFDNTVWDFPECITDFLEEKIQRKADKEAEKLNRFNRKQMDLIDDIVVGE